jgi:hypothetical protein
MVGCAYHLTPSGRSCISELQWSPSNFDHCSKKFKSVYSQLHQIDHFVIPITDNRVLGYAPAVRLISMALAHLTYCI